MSENKRTRCEIDGNAVLPCWALSRAEDGGRKGLVPRQIVDMRKGTLFRTLIAVHSGEFAKRGIVANYCPFCGADIASHLKTRQPAEVQP